MNYSRMNKCSYVYRYILNILKNFLNLKMFATCSYSEM